jgi:hypothetical protein
MFKVLYYDMMAQSQDSRTRREDCCYAMPQYNTFPWQPNNVITATETHTAKEELLEVAFTVGSVQRLYNNF